MRGGWGVSRSRLTFGWHRGWGGVWHPRMLADVICERSLTKSIRTISRKNTPLFQGHFEIMDRENFGDPNCSFPLEMIIFEGKSVQNTSRMPKFFACGALLMYFWWKMVIILIIYWKSTAPKAPKILAKYLIFKKIPPPPLFRGHLKQGGYFLKKFPW